MPEQDKQYSEVSLTQRDMLDEACRYIFPSALTAMHGCMLMIVQCSNMCVIEGTTPAQQLDDLKEALEQMFNQERSAVN